MDHVVPTLPTVSSDAGKRTRRDSLFLMATLTIGEAGTASDVRIRNLSEGGLMADVEQGVRVGTRVSLDVRGVGIVKGAVAWCAEGRIGIAFDAKIDPARARKPVGGGTKTPNYARPVVGR